jgi:hypothetical protein
MLQATTTLKTAYVQRFTLYFNKKMVKTPAQGVFEMKQMKGTKAGVLALLCALVFGLTMTACNGKAESGGAGAKALIGTWKLTGTSITWSFTENRFTQNEWGMKTTVPYKIKDDSIFIGTLGIGAEMKFEIDGDTLTIEGIELPEIMGFSFSIGGGMGFPLELERVK